MSSTQSHRLPTTRHGRAGAWFRRFRQVPGTEDLSRFTPLVEDAVRRRDELRELTDGDVSELAESITAPDPHDAASLVEFLAVASEVARRHLELEPFEVQLLAAAAMLHGRVADMATGEGKTLVGYLVAAGNALSGSRVHVLSANDYLARRDAASGAPFFTAFGLRAAAVSDDMPAEDRQAAYAADITYATAHQVGFDILRDRQRTADDPRLVPELDVAVVDELDAVLIDDAMVPLVLAGDAGTDDSDLALAAAVAELRAGTDYEVDPERRNASFTDAGIIALERRLGIEDLYDEEHTELLTAANVALHAEALVKRDVQYVVEDGRVQLVSDARGRVVERQRWPDGLHSAIERKEGVAVTAQAEVLDQVLVETVVRRYRSMTGMSGTALEAAERLSEDLQLRTGVVATNRPNVRVDEPDQLYATTEQRDAAAVARVAQAHLAGEPVLVGTRSISDSERFAELLSEQGIEARVLNAKNHAQEAEVIAAAGQAGAVTVSTQMAGRGVDIRLGKGVADTGGLLVIGLSRYDSSRLDGQLRGRAGRQGDPGRSVFYTSIEDEVVTDHLEIGHQPRAVRADGKITDRRFAKLYEHAQRVAEGKVLQLHRTTRQYHKVTDQHRASLLDTRERVLDDDAALLKYLEAIYKSKPELATYWSDPDRRDLARATVLYHLDRAWTDHLGMLTEVREGIHLRALARESPLDEFNLIAGRNFGKLGARTSREVRRTLKELRKSGGGLEDLGLRRPSSTWTYLITDNPFGSEADRLADFFGRVLRGGRAREVEHH
ncbi:accessory Sec system translocase SecA2 [Epidermidibacterium keratini]|uniref:Protein translocase subunit SecA n=1 Tax=Epidermidibacterium keratini TaxID=1891644 RepID=A0A7L4YKS9_9ACTN|nr:accessory Sec system translocase SecA2 [Epidermidibacterium keratini]QHB99428.1 accessory Sec system translocase SecA2 [Epidermidibacterium keratini]